MKWACYIAIALVVFCFGFLTGVTVERQRTVAQTSVETEVRRDTTLRVDTVREPVPVPVVKSEVRRDTVWLPTVASVSGGVPTDTVTVRDTVQVVVPIEQKVYADTLYTAWVSGYRPALDSIEVYSRERTVTEHVEVTKTVELTRWKQKHWHIGVTAGYGWGFKGFRPFVGVGLTYSVVSF